MTHQERESINALMLRARSTMKVWLRERDEQLTLQCAADADVKRRWAESQEELRADTGSEVDDD